MSNNNNDEKKTNSISRKAAVSILITILAPIIFLFILMIVFKLFWAIPFVTLIIIVTSGIVNKKRPDFFAALRKPKKADQSMVNLSSGYKAPSSVRRSYMMLVSISHVAQQHITVNSSPFVIGRAPTSDFCISDSYVSNRHLVIEYVAEKKLCYATDVSSNGSYLNSVRMQNNVRRPLYHGDTLQIAGMMYRVEYVHF